MRLSDLSQEDAEMILHVLEPFANAYDRTTYFESPPETARVQAFDPDSGDYELFADKNEAHGKDPEELLTMAHLGAAKRLVDIIKREMHSEEEE